MKPLLLQSKPPAESPWVSSEGCKGLRFSGATSGDWFKVIMDLPACCNMRSTVDVNGGSSYLFNGYKPNRVKIHFVQGSGPVDVDLI